jgi:hypothetical protein
VWRRGPKRWAAIFADDLMAGCDSLLAVYGSHRLSLPISVPIDDRGVVLLRPEGPLDAPRVPATLALARTDAGRYSLAISRTDGGPIVVPGLRDSSLPGPADATLNTLSFDVTAKGMVVSGGPVPVEHDEETARALAHALFITLTVKLAKAPAPPVLHTDPAPDG